MVNIKALLIVFVIIMISMILHELAHGAMAYFLGDDTAKREGRLTLNPLKHLDPVLSVALPLILALTGGPIFGGAKPVPVDSRNLKFGVWGMALVAVAGPLMNFLLAFIAFMIGYFTGAFAVTTMGFWSQVLMDFVLVNLGFGVFNLIPIPPLDGSRVLYAIAPDPIRDVMEKMEHWGIILVMILVVFVPGLVSMIMSGAMNWILQGFEWVARLFG